MLLLIANRKLALCLRVGLAELCQALDGRIIRLNFLRKSDVCLGIFVAGLPPNCQHLGALRMGTGSQCLRRLLCHLVDRPGLCSRPCAFPLVCPQRTCHSLHGWISGAVALPQESCSDVVHTADEEGIACEDGPIIAIFHVVADGILRVTGRV